MSARSHDEIRAAQPLFSAFTADQVSEVRLYEPQGEANELTLVRAQAGHFTLKEKYGFPVRAELAESLARGLAALTTLDLLTESAAEHARYGVQDDAGVRITLLDAEGAIVADLVQGELAPGGRARYVRRVDQNAVYRAPHFHQRVPADWMPWIDSRWMPHDKDLIQKLNVKWGATGAEIELRRLPGSRLQWADGNEKAWARSKVAPVLGALASITVRSVEGLVQAGEEPPSDAIRLNLELAGGLTWQGWLQPQSTDVGDEEGRRAEWPAQVSREGTYRVFVAPLAGERLRRALGVF